MGQSRHRFDQQLIRRYGQSTTPKCRSGWGCLFLFA